MARPQHRAKSVVPYVRSYGFESVAHMNRHDAEIAAILERHEELRHRSEVRSLLMVAHEVGDWYPVTAYLSLARKKRGDLSADRLAADVKAQWKAGNRGKKGDWRDS